MTRNVLFLIEWYETDDLIARKFFSRGMEKWIYLIL